MHASGSYLKRFYLTLDLRTLGFFRILLGGLLIRDWVARWPSLEIFYTSYGALPPETPLSRIGGDFHFSLLDGALSLPMVQFFFWAGLVFYILFWVGYRTKLFHILSFLFFVSVLNRNVLLRSGGDVFLDTLLMWALFLPLGQRFSVDALRNPGRRAERSEPSLAAFAIIFQLAAIYFLAAWGKFGKEWQDGTALYYALHIDDLTRPLGDWLTQRPIGILQGLTWGSLFIEYLAAPLILLPVRQPALRRLALLLTTGLQAGIWMTMQIGDFPLLMIAANVLLLGGEDWALIRRLALRGSKAVAVTYDNTCGICDLFRRCVSWADWGGRVRFIGSSELQESMVVVDNATQRKTTRSQAAAEIFRALPLPFRPLAAVGWPGIRWVSDPCYNFIAQRRHRFSKWLGLGTCGVQKAPEQARVDSPAAVSPLAAASRKTAAAAANAAAAVLFAAILVDSYNINMAGQTKRPIPEPRWIQAIIAVPQLVHDWRMFAPYPVKEDGWWVIDGVTESGESFDPLTGKPTVWEKPKDLSGRYDRFWEKYLFRLWMLEYADYRLYFVRYLTFRNHREMPVGRRLVRFDCYFMREMTQPPGTPRPFPTERVKLWHQECLAR